MVRVPLGQEATTINFLTSTTSVEGEMMSYLWEGLNRLDAESGQIVPSLARLPRVSSDGKTLSYLLGSAACFSDGRKVTSRDVVFSFKAVLNPSIANAALYRSQLNELDSVWAAGDTIHVQISRAYALLPAKVCVVPIMCAELLDPQGLTHRYTWSELKTGAITEPMQKWSEWFQSTDVVRDLSKQIATGPYRVDRWVPGSHIMLVRNTHYWAKAQPWGKVNIDTLIFRPFTSPAASLAAFKQRELDVVGISPHDLRSSNEIILDTCLTNTVSFIAWNTKRPQLADARVRRALSMLIDREAVIRTVYQGFGSVVTGPLPYFIKGAITDNRDAYSTSAARALLAAAGWTDHDGDGVLDNVIRGERTPLKITFIIPAGQTKKRQVIAIISESFRRAGIASDIVTYDIPMLRQTMRSGAFDAALTGVTGDFQEPDLSPLWHSRETKGGLNYSQYENSELDAKLDAFRVEFEPAKRAALLADIQRILHLEQPATYLWSPKILFARWNRFSNVQRFTAELPYRYQYWIPATFLPTDLDR
jgi:peptide/nickel transport system substrate-binding protein